MVVGEVALAVASAGWTPVSGGLDEARGDGHGTRPLLTPSPVPDTAGHAAIPSQVKEQPAEGTQAEPRGQP